MSSTPTSPIFPRACINPSHPEHFILATQREVLVIASEPQADTEKAHVLTKCRINWSTTDDLVIQTGDDEICFGTPTIAGFLSLPDAPPQMLHLTSLPRPIHASLIGPVDPTKTTRVETITVICRGKPPTGANVTAIHLLDCTIDLAAPDSLLHILESHGDNFKVRPHDDALPSDAQPA